ncbi:hypothetical protein HN748_02855 [Candidatus Peregrinibacteria bacterium]|jgi:hypothetical protein|nr:hypothetical protein [Candidatus Peregrinibacteria bacterium]MBT7703147.1 hypothetical protein [Candidatus Peregrinibacteria bacterium]
MEENALENALTQIQAWFVNGEFEKVKQGCEEIIKIAPNNSIAQDLLQKAQEGLGQTTEPETPAPAPPIPEPMPTTEPVPTPEPTAPPIEPVKPPMPPVEPVTPIETPIEDPFGGSMPAPVADEPPMPETVTPTEESFTPEPVEEEHHRQHSLIVNVIILLLLIGIGIGGVYTYQAIFNNDNADDTTTSPIQDVLDEEADEETIDEEIVNEEEIDDEIIEEETDEEEIVNPDAESRNNQRLADLTKIEESLLQYYSEHKQYPSVEEIKSVLIDEDLLESLPVAPLENEAYFYAVYDTDLGPSQDYVLSGYFENEDGTSAPWSTGGNVLTYTDYNDLAQENVTILTDDLTEKEYLNFQEEVETSEDEETEERVRVPRS